MAKSTKNTKPPQPTTDPVEALRRAWARYHEQVKMAIAATTDDNRAAVLKELTKQQEAMAAL